MRTLIIILTAALSMMLASCSITEGPEDCIPEVGANEDAKGYETKSEHIEADSAYVRIGMYSRLDGYNLKIENLRIESEYGEKITTVFGNNIVEVDKLPTERWQAVYDQLNGRYNKVRASAEGKDITLRFDVLMTALDNGAKMRLTDVTYVITSDRTAWQADCHYDYAIGLTADILGLHAIQFNASVDDTHNAGSVEC